MKRKMVNILVSLMLVIIIQVGVVLGDSTIPPCFDREVIDILKRIVLKEIMLRKIVPEKITINENELILIKFIGITETNVFPEKRFCTVKETHLIKWKKIDRYRVAGTERIEAGGFNFTIIAGDGDWIIEAEAPVFKLFEPLKIILNDRRDRSLWGISCHSKCYYNIEDLSEISKDPRIYLEGNYWIYDPLRVSEDIDIKEVRAKIRKEKERERILEELREE